MIQHSYLYDNSNLHVFSEEVSYNKENPALSNFGLQVIIDWKGMKDLLFILINGGSFLAQDRNWNRKFTFNKKENTLTQTYTKPRCKAETVDVYHLTDEKVTELCELLCDTYNDLRAEMLLKMKEKNAKISASMKNRDRTKVNSVDTSSETAPESPKETLPDIPMQKEESVVETQENDKEDVYTNNQQVEEKKPINMLGHGIDEVIDIILKRNNVNSMKELNEPSKAGLKYDIWGQLWDTERKSFENRYGITGPDDMFNELIKVFKPC